MNSLQNSPYFLCHYGVKGRSGKAGAGLWYKNGELTPEGYRHYYGEKMQGKPSNATKQEPPKKKNIGKKIAIGGAAVAAAAVGFIAYRKTTQLRDAMRNNAREEARSWLHQSINSKLMSMHYRTDAKLERYASKTGKYDGTDKFLRRNTDPNEFKAYARRSSLISQDFARNARTFYKKSKEQERIANTLTRRGAVKTYLKDKINAKNAEKQRIADAIEQRRKNYDRAYRIQKYNAR